MTDPELRELVDRGFRYALSLTHDHVAAEDLLQDAWTSVLAANGRMDVGYLIRAIRSRWIDGHRRRQVVSIEPLDAPVVDERTDPRDIDRDALWKAVATLRPQEREVLFLHVIEGHTAAEVAAITDRPRNTVLTLLSRGRSRMRAWFSSQKEAL